MKKELGHLKNVARECQELRKGIEGIDEICEGLKKKETDRKSERKIMEVLR